MSSRHSGRSLPRGLRSGQTRRPKEITLNKDLWPCLLLIGHYPDMNWVAAADDSGNPTGGAVFAFATRYKCAQGRASRSAATKRSMSASKPSVKSM